MALRDKTVGFLGAGNMAEALIRGLLNAETISSASILATARRPERLALLNEKYGVQGITTNIELVQKADIVVLSVKPQILGKVLAETGSIFRQNHLVVSVAAGYPMVEIQRLLTMVPSTTKFLRIGCNPQWCLFYVI